MKTNKSNIYDQITSQIIAELENGIIPWQKPWANGSFMGCISHTTGRPYSLLNQWLLGGRAGEWLTYKQIQDEGGRVRKGEKASTVVFWSFVNKTELEAVCDENGDEIGTKSVIVESYPILKGYTVFHIDQTEGIKPRFNNEAVKYEHEPIEEAEIAIENYISREGLKLEIKNSDRAFYRPSTDSVTVPEREQYKVKEQYYSTLFHELTHSTGHESRLNRLGVAGLHYFGDTEYSKEELIAEIGASFMCQTVGIDCAKAFKNSVAYIQSWLNALKGDKKLIVAAAAKAEQAVNYMLNGKK